MIGSSEVNRQMSAIADIRRKPLNEAQLRELIPVPEEKRVEVWKSAVKLAGDAPVTAKIVRKAAVKFKSRKTKAAGKAKIEKRASPKSINLGTALKLLAGAEKAAEENKDQLVLKKLAALRKCLEALAGK
jgi:hypothetical protein